jgi:poly(3-hydroxybutyrate) depolymerase
VVASRIQKHLAALGGGGDPDELLVLAQLDASLADQVASKNFVALTAVRGIAEPILPALGLNGAAAPVAMFVPPGYTPEKPASLILYLYGRGQTEEDVIASSVIRSLATATGSIVIAPALGADDMLSDDRIGQLYRVLAESKAALSVDARRIFIAGNSVGGFAAFRALGKNPGSWAGTLVVQGAVAEADSDSVARHVSGKLIYLVGGADDQVIKPSYLRQLATWLRQHGALVAYYEQAGGTHTLASVASSFSRAWHDMLAGVRPSAADAVLAVPAAQPTVQHQ